MDVQGLLAAFAVILALVGALLFLRGRGIARFHLPAVRSASSARQLQTVERLALTPHHSLHLVRACGKDILIVVSPGGCEVLDTHTEGASR